jgi:hypothetical protein
MPADAGHRLRTMSAPLPWSLFYQQRGSTVGEGRRRERVRARRVAPGQRASRLSRTIIEIGRACYSVPFRLIGQRAEVRLTANAVEIFQPANSSPHTREPRVAAGARRVKPITGPRTTLP